MTATILVADDDPVQRRLMEAALQKAGYAVICVENGQAALDALATRAIDAMVLDMVMPGLSGQDVLQQIQTMDVQTPVIVQTAQGSMDTAIAAMRAGAFDFLVKPAKPERLTAAIADALKVNDRSRTAAGEKRSRTALTSMPPMIAESEDMGRVRALIEKAAHSDIPVLIEGPSGTGKEMIAREIQKTGRRSDKPFVIVNCGAIPENLVESTLFGHEKGAFTGATEKHIGKFVEANGGTLFLDEIGDLPLAAQVKFLRALQEGHVEPVGGTKPVRVNVRIISATNHDLLDAVRNGTFREDLFYRLNVFPIRASALRYRRDDIAPLAEHFVKRFAASEGKALTLAPSALSVLTRYDWPGNVRQLENTIFRAVVLADGNVLDETHFSQISAQLTGNGQMYHPSPAQPMQRAKLTPPPMGEVSEDHHLDPVEETTSESISIETLIDRDSGHVRPLNEIEALAIRNALDVYEGQMSEIARRLGIGRSTLYRKIKEYGIETEAVR